MSLDKGFKPGHTTKLGMQCKSDAMASEARGILILLSFGGIWDFAKRAGINHETAGQLLGTVKAKGKKNYGLVVRCHEALHSAYVEHYAEMSRPKRNYIKDWVKHWKKRVVAEQLRLTSTSRVAEKQDPYQDQKMVKRHTAVKAGVVQAMDSLKWE